MRNNAYLKSLMFQDLGMRLLTRGGGFTKNETCLALNLNRGFSRHIFQNIFCFNEVINMNFFPCFPGTSLSTCGESLSGGQVAISSSPS